MLSASFSFCTLYGLRPFFSSVCSFSPAIYTSSIGMRAVGQAKMLSAIPFSLKRSMIVDRLKQKTTMPYQFPLCRKNCPALLRMGSLFRACPAVQECPGQSPHQRTGAVPGLLAKTKVGKALEHRRGLGRLSPNNIDGMVPSGAFLSPLTGRQAVGLPEWLICRLAGRQHA